MRAKVKTGVGQGIRSCQCNRGNYVPYTMLRQFQQETAHGEGAFSNLRVLSEQETGILVCELCR